MMKPLAPPDIHHLNAAEGWIGLGNVVEAENELGQLSLKARDHPEVLRVKYHLYERTKSWERAANVAELIYKALPEAPFGWIQLAYALHELKRTREAYQVLLPQIDRFPDEYIIRYNLACYACQLGNLEEARQWLRKAIAIIGTDTVKEMASNDLDLQPLQSEIKSL